MVAEEIKTVPLMAGGVSGVQPAPENVLPPRAERALTFGLLVSALRCTIQYVLLPFVLPLVGLSGAVPPWLTLVLSGVALASLGRNVRYLWRIHHARRWSYLGLASMVGAALVLFIVMDVRNLLG